MPHTEVAVIGDRQHQFQGDTAYAAPPRRMRRRGRRSTTMPCTACITPITPPKPPRHCRRAFHAGQAGGATAMRAGSHAATQHTGDLAARPNDMTTALHHDDADSQLPGGYSPPDDQHRSGLTPSTPVFTRIFASRCHSEPRTRPLCLMISMNVRWPTTTLISCAAARNAFPAAFRRRADRYRRARASTLSAFLGRLTHYITPMRARWPFATQMPCNARPSGARRLIALSTAIVGARDRSGFLATARQMPRRRGLDTPNAPVAGMHDEARRQHRRFSSGAQ